MTWATLRSLYEPKAKDKDNARREFILNVLLLGTLFLACIATLLIIYLNQSGQQTQSSPSLLFIITLGFLALYFFSRAGFQQAIAHIYVLFFLCCGLYTSYTFGVSIPQAVLVYALVVVIAGILISTKYAFFITGVIFICLMYLTYLELLRGAPSKIIWHETPLNYSDAIMYSISLGIIAIVSWLSNREIEKSLLRARASEASLKRERDLLEIKVEERTKELKQLQLEKVMQLYRFADFGRLTSGLFHDLVNPLTSVSLSLESLNGNNTSEIVKRAIHGTKRMEKFVHAVRRQVQGQSNASTFFLEKEIRAVLRVLKHKAADSQVELIFDSKKYTKAFASPVRFNQLVTNLVSNAIDAYDGDTSHAKRQVVVHVSSQASKAIITVIDYGQGISQKNLTKIFDPFFTTKTVEKGTGVGLYLTKEIAEKDFDGSIQVQSKRGKGTTFIVTFPLQKPPQKLN